MSPKYGSSPAVAAPKLEKRSENICNERFVRVEMKDK